MENVQVLIDTRFTSTALCMEVHPGFYFDNAKPMVDHKVIELCKHTYFEIPFNYFHCAESVSARQHHCTDLSVGGDKVVTAQWLTGSSVFRAHNVLGVACLCLKLYTTRVPAPAY